MQPDNAVHFSIKNSATSTSSGWEQRSKSYCGKTKAAMDCPCRRNWKSCSIRMRRATACSMPSRPANSAPYYIISALQKPPIPHLQGRCGSRTSENLQRKNNLQNTDGAVVTRYSLSGAIGGVERKPGFQNTAAAALLHKQAF